MRAFRIGVGVTGAALLVLLSAGPALAAEVRVTGSGSGADEAPDPGEEGATIEADMTIDTESGAITYTVTLAGNSEDAAAAHIHRAPPGEAGDVVVPLDHAAINAGEEASATADPALAAEIATSPGEFYVNVHSASFPGGFARAQLEAAAPDSVPTGDGSSRSNLPALIGVGLVVVGVGAVAVGLARRRGDGSAA
jgi:CHRD domain